MMVSKRQLQRIEDKLQGKVKESKQVDDELLITVHPARNDDIEDFPAGKEEVWQDDPEGLTIKLKYEKLQE